MATVETEKQEENLTTAERIRQRRLARMRMGQAVCEIIPLLSDPEVRVALVPLTEAEYDRTLQIAATAPYDDSIAANNLRDMIQRNEILAVAAREVDNLEERIWENGNEFAGDVEVQDVNHLYDAYMEMVDTTSPSVQGLTEEEIESLKKVLLALDWNVLSGKSWYALKRFLGSLMNTPHLGKLPGSISTKWSITTNGEDEST